MPCPSRRGIGALGGRSRGTPSPHGESAVGGQLVTGLVALRPQIRGGSRARFQSFGPPHPLAGVGVHHSANGTLGVTSTRRNGIRGRGLHDYGVLGVIRVRSDKVLRLHFKAEVAVPPFPSLPVVPRAPPMRAWPTHLIWTVRYRPPLLTLRVLSGESANGGVVDDQSSHPYTRSDFGDGCPDSYTGSYERRCSVQTQSSTEEGATSHGPGSARPTQNGVAVRYSLTLRSPISILLRPAFARRVAACST